jgi:hypothetical protein
MTARIGFDVQLGGGLLLGITRNVAVVARRTAPWPSGIRQGTASIVVSARTADMRRSWSAPIDKALT